MKRTLICVGLVIVGGCGGGGSSAANEAATTSTSATATTATATQSASSGPAVLNTTVSGSVSLLTPVPSAATRFSETGDPAVDSLAFINNQRVQLGLPALTQNAAVASAAANHSLYLYGNNQIGHYETAGLVGYTGNAPADRIGAVYSSNATGEILIAYQGIKAFPSSSQPIQALFEAPFHRGVALYDYSVAGVGYKQSGDTAKVSALTMDFAGEQATLGATQMIASPYNGQTNVDTSWYASESPSPFEGNTAYNNTVVGYPILLTGGISSSLSVSSFTLATAAGVNVPCQKMDESVDAAVAGMATCTPYAPLTPSTSYIATAVGTVKKPGQPAQAFDLQWEFTTASTANVPYDSPSRLGASTTLDALASHRVSPSTASAATTVTSTARSSLRAARARHATP